MSDTTHCIFDLDGTLYRFKGAPGTTFSTSIFYRDLRQRIVEFLAERLDISPLEAEQVRQTIHSRYNGEVSRGVECAYQIDRYDFFAHTWDCDPSVYVTHNGTLATRMRHLQ